jgi:hypothetical protein
LGFVWRTREDGRAALRGSFGIYYENDVFGNWDAPPPDSPPLEYQFYDLEGNPHGAHSLSAPWTVPRDHHLKPPRSLQYSLGYEFQPTENTSVGALFVYKDTTNLIGWQILGGQFQTYPFTDPFTGRQYTMLWATTAPTIQKGNSPGDFPGGEDLRYFQIYDGLVLTFTKRFSHDWAINASYTLSKSYGLIPRMLSQKQFQPFYGSREGSDPNHYINATGYLQADRTHMFRTQILCSRLPWNLQAATSIEFSSGRPYTRQIRVHAPVDYGAWSTVIMEPGGILRHSPVQNIDLSVGKWISIGDRLQVNVEGQIFNLLNSSQELSFAALILQDPTQTFVPNSWVQPRRLQIHIGVQY